MTPGNWVRDMRHYMNDVQVEYKKITWPPQKEAVAGLIGVVVIVAIVTTVLGTIDFGLSQLFSAFLG